MKFKKKEIVLDLGSTHGFDLSMKGWDYYAELKGVKLLPPKNGFFVDLTERKDTNGKTWLLSNIKRDDKFLIETIHKLGCSATNYCRKLGVFAISTNKKYKIEEFTEGHTDREGYYSGWRWEELHEIGKNGWKRKLKSVCVFDK